eukprot:scaffold2923_cov313-Pinguiococcus_pyrenoidosus.AAC.15
MLAETSSTAQRKKGGMGKALQPGFGELSVSSHPLSEALWRTDLAPVCFDQNGGERFEPINPFGDSGRQIRYLSGTVSRVAMEAAVSDGFANR